jgi:hypothetical protein
MKTADAAALLEVIMDKLQQEADQAGDVFRRNKKENAPAVSTAYDEGRRRGLLDALEIVRGYYR